MADQESKGDEYVRKADKKMKGWGVFGNKYEDASELLDKAANHYKLGKAWDKAGNTYKQLAEVHLKLDSKHEAASAYVDAANAFKKTNSAESTACLEKSVDLFQEIGRLSMAAKHYKDMAEISEKEEDGEKAMMYYEKAAELYSGEGVNSTSDQCRLKVAQFAAQLGELPKAIEIFESVARQSMDNNLLKYSVKGYLLNAGLCHLCSGDIVNIQNAIDKYADIDPSFSNTREHKLLVDLAAAMEEFDVDAFTDKVRDFDSMTRLDPWKTTLLLKAKNTLKEKENEPEDLM